MQALGVGEEALVRVKFFLGRGAESLLSVLNTKLLGALLVGNSLELFQQKAPPGISGGVFCSGDDGKQSVVIQL